jgi:cytochrome oxidase Cu insertion factor (SCO1/SenC/PrrC family)
MEFETVSKITDKQLYSDILQAKEQKYSILGQYLPGTPLNDSEGKIVNLKTLKGKVILLDFWYTSCGPCILGIPETNELAKRFPKDFLVVSVCIGCDSAKWKAVIQSFQYTGLHLWDIESKGLQQYFNIHSFPSFALLNKDGQILYYPAPRPGDPKLDELIKEMITE